MLVTTQAGAVVVEESDPRLFTEREPLMAGWLRPSFGYYNFSRGNNPAGEVRLEYFFKKKLWMIQPFLGMSYTTTADFFGFVGIGIDFYFTPGLYLFPSFALGYFKHTRGVDLGYPLEFREGIEIGWHFQNEVRVGVNLVHMSNSQLGKTNPGQETIAAVISVPIFFSRPQRRAPATEAAAPCSCPKEP